MIAILVSNMSKNSAQGFERTGKLSLQNTTSLERSCEGEFRDGLRIAAESRGIERIEARFHGNGFSPHRHDTYALGLTLHGVQTFRYRGAERYSNPANVIVLHPDEIHDGAAGTEEGLIYRMIYLLAELISAVDGYTNSLPFVSDPVMADAELWRALADILSDLDHEPDDLVMDDVIERVASTLFHRAGTPRKPITKIARSAVLQAREFLVDNSDAVVRSETLEALTGLDRYELARQFRQILGTSPHRYLIMRRLGHAKRMLVAGSGLAVAAVEAGFSDQAHFTRHFRATFGITPGKWLAMHKSQH